VGAIIGMFFSARRRVAAPARSSASAGVPAAPLPDDEAVEAAS
jgi:hypothetical protein